MTTGAFWIFVIFGFAVGLFALFFVHLEDGSNKKSDKPKHSANKHKTFSTNNPLLNE